MAPRNGRLAETQPTLPSPEYGRKRRKNLRPVERLYPEGEDTQVDIRHPVTGEDIRTPEDIRWDEQMEQADKTEVTPSGVRLKREVPVPNPFETAETDLLKTELYELPSKDVELIEEEGPVFPLVREKPVLLTQEMEKKSSAWTEGMEALREIRSAEPYAVAADEMARLEGERAQLIGRKTSHFAKREFPHKMSEAMQRETTMPMETITARLEDIDDRLTAIKQETRGDEELTRSKERVAKFDAILRNLELNRTPTGNQPQFLLAELGRTKRRLDQMQRERRGGKGSSTEQTLALLDLRSQAGALESLLEDIRRKEQRESGTHDRAA